MNFGASVIRMKLTPETKITRNQNSQKMPLGTASDGAMKGMIDMAMTPASALEGQTLGCLSLRARVKPRPSSVGTRISASRLSGPGRFGRWPARSCSSVPAPCISPQTTIAMPRNDRPMAIHTAGRGGSLSRMIEKTAPETGPSATKIKRTIGLSVTAE